MTVVANRRLSRTAATRRKFFLRALLDAERKEETKARVQNGTAANLYRFADSSVLNERTMSVQLNHARASGDCVASARQAACA